MDVIVVLSDRKLSAADARNTERLETLVRGDGLVALVVRSNPDAKIMSAEPLHPAFTARIAATVGVFASTSAQSEVDARRRSGICWSACCRPRLRRSARARG